MGNKGLLEFDNLIDGFVGVEGKLIGKENDGTIFTSYRSQMALFDVE